MIKNNPVTLKESDLDKLNGGFSWGASNPTTSEFKNSDGILHLKRGQHNGVLIGDEGRDFLEGGADIDT